MDLLRNFEELMARIRGRDRITLSVAVAQDEEILQAVKDAHEQGVADAILVGDEGLIRPMAQRAGLPSSMRIVHEIDPYAAADAAVRLVRDGEAQVLMKGLSTAAAF